jgi:hypothetical protein
VNSFGMGTLLQSSSYITLVLLLLGVSCANRILGDSSSTETYDCYISNQGDGLRSGSTRTNAYAWSNGEGLEQCLADVLPGDTIFLAYSDSYQLSNRIEWNKSGRPGRFITLLGEGTTASGGDFGQSVLRVQGQWPRITGTRSTTEGRKGGSSFLRFGQDVSYVQVQNLNLHRFNTAFLFGDRERQFRNHHIFLSDIYVEYAREVISIFGQNENSGAEFWNVNRIYALGISKRMIRAEGLKNSVLSDLYVDTQSPQGQIFFDDWPLLLHFSGPSQNILVERTIAKNPGQRKDNYDNGDCFTTESNTSYIRFDTVRCFDAFDAAFDLKGQNHQVENAIAFRIGNRAFRIWDGPVTIRNAIAGFDGQGQYTREAMGSNAAIWAKGKVDVERFTSINNTTPYLLDGGHIKISASIIALTRFYADRSLEAHYEGERGTVEEDGTVVRWVEEQYGRNPEFVNPSNMNWDGQGDDFDSQYYENQRGFQNTP